MTKKKVTRDTHDLAAYLPLSEQFKSTNSPFYWAARLNAKYSNRLDELLKPLGLNTAKWRVLMILHEHGQLSMSEITKHVVAKLSTITKTVYRMQADDLVKTLPSLDDARVTEVTLTENGLEQLMEARKVTSRFIENALHGLDEDEIVGLTRTLEKVFRNMNGV